MKIHRFIGNFDLFAPTVISRDEELLNQIKNVLRLSAKEQVILSTGNGEEVLATIEGLNKEEVSFKVLEKFENTAESEKFVTIFCSMLKKENFELVAQKATECGVKKIVPIITARTIKTGVNRGRLEKIIREACEQSGRGTVPVLGESVSLEQALEDSMGNDINLFFHIQEANLIDVSKMKKIGLFVGPEGGWTDRELKLAKEKGCRFASLGKLVLRGETAAIVATFWAVNS